MLRRWLVTPTALLGVLAAVAGCGAATPTQANSSTIVASFYPWAWLARQIAGDSLTVKDLTAAGVDPHDLELTARQVIDIEQALLVVYVEGMQPAMDDAVEQHAKDHALDAGSVVDTLPATDAIAAASAAEHGRRDEGASGRQPAGFDPHIWLDPVRFAAVAKELGNRIARADPAHADQYRQRTERLVSALGELDDEYRSGLRNCRSRMIVTSHASFGYLADRYNLEQVGVVGLDPHVPPSPSRLAAVARLIETEDVTVIFLERLTNSDDARTLAREVGARTAVLDPIAGLRPDSSAGYLSLMRANLATLRKALGCS